MPRDLPEGYVDVEAEIVPALPDVIRTIGTLDRCLSELKILAKSGRLDEADRQTVKHHAEDCVLLGNHVLKILGADHIDPAVVSKAFGFT